MIQRSFIADSQILHLDVPTPTSFVGKEINLFLYAHDELEETVIGQSAENKKWKFANTPVNISNYKFNRDEANER